MEGRRLSLAAVFLLAVVSFASAQQFSVAFVDGSAQLKAGAAWKELDVGQKLENASTLRLAAGSVLELVADGGRSILLSKAGVYDLAALAKSAPVAKSSATKLLRVMDKLVTGTGGAAPTTVAGVRGAAAGTDQLLWLEDEEDPEALYSSGRQAEAEGRYSEAAVLYDEALRVVNERSTVDKGRAALSAFAAARAWVQASQLGRALSTLKSADPQAAGEIRPAYTLLLAALLAESGDVEAARGLVEKGKAGAWFSGESASEADAFLAGLPKK